MPLCERPCSPSSRCWSRRNSRPAPRAASAIDGLWEATVVANGVEIPFRFEIATKRRRGPGLLLRGRPKVGSTSGHFADGVLTLEYDFLNTTLSLALEGDQLQGTYIEQARQRETAGRPRAPLHAGAAGRRRSAEARRQLGDAAEGRRGDGAARHAHLAPHAAAVGRRSLGRHPAHRRRHGHAGRALAEQQAGAEPLRRRTSDPARGDGEPGRHARRHAQPHRDTTSPRAAPRRARSAFRSRPIRRATPTSRIRRRRSTSASRTSPARSSRTRTRCSAARS